MKSSEDKEEEKKKIKTHHKEWQKKANISDEKRADRKNDEWRLIS